MNESYIRGCCNTKCRGSKGDRANMPAELLLHPFQTAIERRKNGSTKHRHDEQ